MSHALQMRLLRALQEREFERVGDNQTIKVDVRVIAATNSELARMVSEGSFRDDLYYRLNVINVQLPPLRDRREDIPLLVKHFLDRFANGRAVHFSQGAMRALMAYPWPGNVRQLENFPDDGLDLPAYLGTIERDLIGRALERTRGNRNRAAELLRIKRTTLVEKLKRLGAE